MVRTPCLDKNGLKKGTWTPEEDRKLKAYVTKYGCWNWRQLPKYAGLSRCGKSCRLRWLNYLRPDVKRGNYTKEEEDTILRLHASLGNRWSAIAAQLPGRTDNEIKNHWHTNLKKRMQKDSISKKKPKCKFRETRDQKQQNNISINSIVDSSVTPQPVECSSMSMESSTPSTSTPSTSTDEFALSEQFEESIGNWWTEPFDCDSYYTPIEFVSPFSDPFCQLLDDEMSFTYSLFDHYDF